MAAIPSPCIVRFARTCGACMLPFINCVIRSEMAVAPLQRSITEAHRHTTRHLLPTEHHVQERGRPSIARLRFLCYTMVYVSSDLPSRLCPGLPGFFYVLDLAISGGNHGVPRDRECIEKRRAMDAQHSSRLYPRRLRETRRISVDVG